MPRKNASSEETKLEAVNDVWEKASIFEQESKQVNDPKKSNDYTRVFDDKHVLLGQGLDFLQFSQGNRGPNQQNRRTTKEFIRNH